MKKLIILAAIALLTLQTAYAATVTNLNTLAQPQTYLTQLDTSTILSGIFDFMYIGSDAGNTNTLNTVSGPVFNGKTSTPGATASGNIADFYIKDSDGTPSTLGITFADNTYLKIFQATENIFYNSLTILSGSYIFAFNDDGKAGDKDFNDLIFSGKTAPVPVPAAVWMLGTGLVGLLGLRRFRKE